MLEFKLQHNADFQQMYVVMKDTDMEDEAERYENIVANEQIENDQQLFKELIATASRIKDTFVPLGRPGKFPKLFSRL